jgi:hypothetical protein
VISERAGLGWPLGMGTEDKSVASNQKDLRDAHRLQAGTFYGLGDRSLIADH